MAYGVILERGSCSSEAILPSAPSSGAPSQRPVSSILVAGTQGTGKGHPPAKANRRCSMSGCPASAEAASWRAWCSHQAVLELLQATLMASVSRLLPLSLLKAAMSFSKKSPEPLSADEDPSMTPFTAAATM